MPDNTTVTWNAMIHGYMKAGEVLLAERLFNEMDSRDVATWISMITGYDWNGRFEEALRLFKTMLGEGFTPNQASLVGALSATSRLASLSNRRWVHSYIVKNGYNLDGVLGLVDHGHRYFDTMEREYGFEPTIEHYGCFVDILCRAGRLKEAKYVINTIPVKPNQVIWMSLLSGSRNRGNLKMGEYAAKHIIETAQVIWMSLLSRSRNQGNLKMGEYAAKHIIETAPETIGCYIVLSNMYATAGLWRNVAEVREMMKKNGIKKNPGCSFIGHKGMLHQFTIGDKSHPQTDRIFLKLTEMGEKLKSAGYVLDTSQVLLCIDVEEDNEAELQNRSERLAVAFGLINVDAGTPIRVMKNLRVCSDCHSTTKLLSSFYGREVIVRDNSHFHHFRNGSCSCTDFW